jgi:tetratricopeptide (TPR) repeat protein
VRFEAGDRDRKEVAQALHVSGLGYLSAGRAERALELFDQAIERTRRIYPEEAPQLALVLADRARALLDLGRATEAEDVLRDALARGGRVVNPAPNFLGVARLQLGRALAAQGRFAEARGEMRAAHEELLGSVGAQNPDTLEAGVILAEIEALAADESPR